MNLFLPRSIQSQIEISELVSVPNLIISPQSNRPVSGCIQDIILGVRNLSFDNSIIFSQNKIIDLLLKLDMNFDKNKKEWNNKEIFSLFLPSNLNYKNDDLIIKNGKILAGILTKKHIGIAYGSLIHVIWNDYGAEYTKNFINKLQTFIIYWMAERGESVGISDTILDIKTQKEINKIVNNSLLDVENDKIKFENGIIKNEEFEILVLNKLNKIRDSTGSLAINNIFNNNRLKNMISSGSKGNYLNIAQIMSSVGQQSIRTIDGTFGRVDNGFNDRTLPCYSWGENNPESKGFIESSYLKGLNPQEFFFHSMSGRLGVIDTAIRTSDSGYLQRKLIKMMEDIHINNANYVQNSSHQIIQFIYGSDCLDATFLEYTNLKINNLTEEEFNNIYLSSCDDENQTLINIRNEIKLLNIDKVLVPFSIYRILNSIEISNEILSDKEYYLMVSNFMNSFSINSSIDIFKNIYLRNIKFVIYSYLFSNNLKKLKISKQTLEFIFEEISTKFSRAIIQPGEMVGVLASQSIGEILTQLTLNTFHSAGIASQTKITAGIPRFRELINVSKSPSVPLTKLYFKDKNLSTEQMKIYMEQLKFSKFKEYIKELEIYYDPEFEYYNNIKTFFKQECGKSPYVLIINLNDETMFKKRITIFELIQKLNVICNSYNFNINYTLDNDDNPQIQLRFKEYSETDLKEILNCILKIENEIINGINGIEEIFLEKDYLIIETKKYLSLINYDFVDPYKSITNNLFETLEVLGIEAARELIKDEIIKVLDDNGIYINLRHINLICDLICHKTSLISMDRHGIKKMDVGCLTKSSFEESVEQLSLGAVFNQQENMNGVSINIILGQLGNFGTNYNKAILDFDKI